MGTLPRCSTPAGAVCLCWLSNMFVWVIGRSCLVHLSIHSFCTSAYPVQGLCSKSHITILHTTHSFCVYCILPTTIMYAITSRLFTLKYIHATFMHCKFFYITWLYWSWRSQSELLLNVNQHRNCARWKLYVCSRAQNEGQGRRLIWPSKGAGSRVVGMHAPGPDLPLQMVWSVCKMVSGYFIQ